TVNMVLGWAFAPMEACRHSNRGPDSMLDFSTPWQNVRRQTASRSKQGLCCRVATVVHGTVDEKYLGWRGQIQMTAYPSCGLDSTSERKHPGRNRSSSKPSVWRRGWVSHSLEDSGGRSEGPDF